MSTELAPIDRAQRANAGGRARWIALVVLCVGMLMIVLDATIVNVALPSIQDDLGFSQSSLAWVVNAYLIAFGGLLLLAGRLGDLVGPRRIFIVGLAVFIAASLALRPRPEPGDAGRRALHPGRRRRDDLGRDPGHDRDDVPRAAGAGEGDRRLQLRRRRRRLDRAAARAASSPRRSTGTGSSSSTCRSGSPPRSWRCGWSTATRAIGVGQRRRHPRRDAARQRPDARRLHDRRAGASYGWGSAHTLGFGAASLALLGGLRRPRGASGEPAGAAAHLPLAQRLRRQRDPGADGRRDLRDVLPRRDLPAAGARLRRARGRPRLPAGDGADRPLSLGFSARLNMRFGARATLLPGLGLVAAGLLCSRARRSTAAT